jgi:hypothetical protein
MKKVLQAIGLIPVVAAILITIIIASQTKLLPLQELSNAAICDTSFFTVSNTTFQKNCLTIAAPIYLNRTDYTLFSIPSQLQSATFIKTPNTEIKDNPNLSFTVTVNRPSTVYVMPRHIPNTTAPSWITSAYQRLTNDDMSNLSQYLQRKNESGLLGLYDIYKKDIPTGTIQFRAASNTGELAYSMYLIALVPNTNSSPTLAPTSTPIRTASPIPTAFRTSPPLPTPIPTPPGPTPTIPPIGTTTGIWISRNEILALPTSGTAWDRVRSAAYSSWGSPCLNDLNCLHDTKVLAGALVAIRLNDNTLRTKVITNLEAVKSSPLDRTLELARNIQSYVIAADIIGYHSSALDTFVRSMMDKSLPGRAGIPTVWQGALKDATNWGNHQRAAALTTYLYLNDTAKVAEVVRAHREYIGENVSPKTLTYDSTNWIADQSNKAGVNRKGSTIQGKVVSGVLPEDWRRGSEFKWPPTASGYMLEGMQGYVVTSAVLHRKNLVSFSAGDSAIVRAMHMLFGTGEAAANSPIFRYPPTGDDTWMTWVVNKYGGTSFPTTTATPGKNMAWTDWTHAR